ncbi:MAG TPA: HIT family protein [Verrucomicrobiae bacterium]|nr:HIT family protein [Verrucomicrobiae bacterium]
MSGCTFCDIISGGSAAEVVLSDEHCVAFLDRRPLFPGHVLLVPRRHVATLPELPPELLLPFFSNLRLLAAAVREATGSEGTFVGNNNRVSQSVPHLHFHVVPRTRGDGLRGFFWPRTRYDSPEAAAVTARRIGDAVQRLRE